MSGVYCFVFSVVPTEDTHLRFVPLSTILLDSSHSCCSPSSRRSCSIGWGAGSGGVRLVLFSTIPSLRHHSTLLSWRRLPSLLPPVFLLPSFLRSSIPEGEWFHQFVKTKVVVETVVVRGRGLLNMLLWDPGQFVVRWRHISTLLSHLI